MNIDLIENYLTNTAFGFLLVGLILYWLNLVTEYNKNLSKISNISTIVVNICLAIILSLRWIYNKYFPLSNLYESLIFLTWSLTFIQILTQIKIKNKLLGAITTPISLFIMAFLSIYLPDEMKIASPLVPALRSNWLLMHVTVMMISYATLIIGSLVSILFLIIANGTTVFIQGNSFSKSRKIVLQYTSKDIKNIVDNNNNHQTERNIRLQKLNLLQAIDNLSYRTIGLGFPLLTIGIISGAVWANEAWGTYWSWDPKETWALITWITFAIYLHTRLNKQLTGKIPAIIASLGFIIIWICYLGVNFLGKGLHSYGWILS
uniref:Cytochrome c biogenesis protein CcsA n=1 Tax=Ophidocladus simpliciusculus TaxID=1261574 RepID=A0A1Z1MJM4_9FLOR|nr:cytochrome c biogenesis protein ccs1 [Ophidocladus simpliciusculus]ARW65954.1 cytochrome c biogenesis protein ccs1 [Ophidocladus simpliciusculus]